MKTKERGGAHPGIEGYGRPPSVAAGCLTLSPYKEQPKKNLGGRSPKRVRTFQKSLVFSSFSSFMGRPSIFKEGGETTSTRPPTNYLHTRAGFCFQSGTEYQDVNRVDDYHLAPYFHRPICFRSNGFRVGQGLSLSLSCTGSVTRHLLPPTVNRGVIIGGPCFRSDGMDLEGGREF